MGKKATCVTVTLFWVWLATAAVLYSDPGTIPGMFGSLVVGGILIAVAVLLGFVWVCSFLIAKPAPRSHRMRRVWWSAPAVLVLGFSLAVTDLALTTRVWLCEAELREFAEAIPRTPGTDRSGPPKRVGLFHVRGASARGPDTHLNIGSGFFSTVGVAHRPNGGPPEMTEGKSRTRYRHLYGPWYHYENAQTGPLF